MRIYVKVRDPPNFVFWHYEIIDIKKKVIER
jgi:hypothetical protein